MWRWWILQVCNASLTSHNILPSNDNKERTFSTTVICKHNKDSFIDAAFAKDNVHMTRWWSGTLGYELRGESAVVVTLELCSVSRSLYEVVYRISLSWIFICIVLSVCWARRHHMKCHWSDVRAKQSLGDPNSLCQRERKVSTQKRKSGKVSLRNRSQSCELEMTLDVHRLAAL